MRRKKATKKKKPPAEKEREATASSYQAAKQSAYGDDKPICRNAKCKLRKASCAGFTGCPGFKA